MFSILRLSRSHGFLQKCCGALEAPFSSCKYFGFVLIDWKFWRIDDFASWLLFVWLSYSVIFCDSWWFWFQAQQSTSLSSARWFQTQSASDLVSLINFFYWIWSKFLLLKWIAFPPSGEFLLFVLVAKKFETRTNLSIAMMFEFVVWESIFFFFFFFLWHGIRCI